MAKSMSTAEWLLHRAVGLGLAYAFMVTLPAFVKPRWEGWRAAAGSDALFTIIGTWSMNVILTTIGNICMAFVYAADATSPSISRFRISPTPWPWHSKSEKERAEFWSFLPWSISLVLFNNFCVALPLGIAEYHGFWVSHGFHPPLSAATFPDTFTLAWQLGVCLVLEDAFFYWTHRLLHHKALYPHVHKWHHQYHAPWTLASEHAHPVEFILGNLVPVFAGPHALELAAKLTGNAGLEMHTFALWWWILLRIGTSLDNHCGYAFPWSPVRLLPSSVGAQTDFHDFHHSHNTGMFASQFAWWDKLMGTDATFNAWQAKEAAKEEGGKGKGGKAE